VQYFKPLTIVSHGGHVGTPVHVDFDTAAVQDWWVNPAPPGAKR
jgi:hypothetical protein